MCRVKVSLLSDSGEQCWLQRHGTGRCSPLPSGNSQRRWCDYPCSEQAWWWLIKYSIYFHCHHLFSGFNFISMFSFGINQDALILFQYMRTFWHLGEETLFTSALILNMRRRLHRAFRSPEERSLKWLTHFMMASWETGWQFAVTMTTSCWKKASSQTKAGVCSNCMHVFMPCFTVSVLSCFELQQG